MPRDARFWRNVTIIAVAHIAIIVTLVRWNREARKAEFAEHRLDERRWHRGRRA